MLATKSSADLEWTPPPPSYEAHNALVQPRAARRTAALLALVLAAVLIAALAASRPAVGQDEPQVPAAPSGLEVTTEAGSLEVVLDWDDVDDATGYRVRWRSAEPGGKLNEGEEVSVSEAVITVAASGAWVVRVQACNDAGCGKPAAKNVAVEPAPEPEVVPEPEVLTEPVQDPVTAQQQAEGELTVSVRASTTNPFAGDQVNYSADIGGSPEGEQPTYQWELSYDGAFWFPSGSDPTFSYLAHQPETALVRVTVRYPSGAATSEPLSLTWRTFVPQPQPPAAEGARGAVESVSVTIRHDEAVPRPFQPGQLVAVVSNLPTGEQPRYRWEMNLGGNWWVVGSEREFPWSASLAETVRFRVTVFYGTDQAVTSPELALVGTDEQERRTRQVTAAQTSVALAGNTDAADAANISFDQDIIHGFETGNNEDGYKLTSLQIDFAVGGTAPTYTVQIRQGNQFSSTLIGSLNPVNSPTMGLNSFTASGTGIDLEPNTTNYFVAIELQGSVATLKLNSTTSNTLNTNPAPARGWRIKGGSFRRAWNSNDTPTGNLNGLKMIFNGYAKQNPPVLESATIDDSLLVLTFDRNMDATSGTAPGQFTIKVGGGSAQAATAISIVGKEVLLTVPSVARDVAVTVSYVKPSSDPLKASNGAELAEFTDEGVVNGESIALIGNIGQTHSHDGSLVFDYAQSFTTGSSAEGYRLTNVQLGVLTGGALSNYTVKIVSQDNSGQPGSTVGTLTALSSLTAGTNNSFAGIVDLDPNTTYYFYLDLTAGGSTAQLTLTDADQEDSGGADGWSIGDSALTRNPGQTTSWSIVSNSAVLQIIVNGYEKQPPALDSATIGGTTLVLTFDKDLDTASGTAAGAFTIKAGGGGAQAATAITIADRTVTLTVPTVTAGQAVTVSYTKPTSNPLQGSDGLEVAAITDHAVANTTIGSLIGNTGATAATNLNFDNDRAQSFTTGTNAAGYKLTSVQLDISGSASLSGTVSINSGTSAGPSETPLVRLSAPTPLTGGLNTFSGEVILAPSTTYWVVVDVTATHSALSYKTTNAAVSSGGWAIPKGSKNRAFSTTGDPSSWSSIPGRSLKMIVNGQARTISGGVISNALQADTTHPFSWALDLAQPFTTGTDSRGYTLNGVRLDFVAGVSSVGGYSIKILSNTSDNSGPGTQTLGTLSNQTSLTAGINRFTGSVDLDANTTYYLFLDQSVANTYVNAKATASDAEDTGGAAGWSIGDTSYFRTVNELDEWTEHEDTEVLKLIIDAEVKGIGPELVSAEINGAILELTFDQALDATSVPAAGAFSIKVDDGDVQAATAVGIIGKTVTLSVPSVRDDDKVIVSYARPSANPLKGVFRVATFVDESVTNNTPEPQATLTTMISNDGQTDGTVVVWEKDRAQSFTTGSDSAGYLLTSVQLTGTVAGSLTNYSVKIVSATADGAPGATVYGTLRTLGSLSAGNDNKFKGNVDLAANTTYFVFFDLTEASTAQVKTTDSDAEDAGGASGWSIGNIHRERAPGQSAGWGVGTRNQDALKIIVNGYAKSESPVLKSAEIRGASLVLTFDNDLFANSGTGAGSFAINVDGGAGRPATTIAIEGKVATLTVPGVTGGQGVTVSYTKPGTSPLKDVNQLELASFSNQAVTNNTPIVDTGILVSNRSQTASTGTSIEQANIDLAQAFTTGSNVGGYRLSSVTVDFDLDAGATPPTVTLKVCEESSSSPSTPKVTCLGNLDNQASLPGGRINFESWGGINLDANTTYYLLLQTTAAGSGGTRVGATDADDEDDGAESGWSIADDSLTKLHTASSWTSQTDSWRIQVLGVAKTAPALESAVVEGTELVLTFDQELDVTSIPPPGSFALVVADGSNQFASEISIAGTQVTLTVPRVPGFRAVDVYYFEPLNARLKGTDGAEVFSISAHPVSNLTGGAAKLVGNVYRGSSEGQEIQDAKIDYAQAFRTGSHAAGYWLSSVDLRFEDASTSPPTFTLHVCEGTESAPDSGCWLALAHPSTYVAGGGKLNSFRPSGGFMKLKANTTYYLVMKMSAAGTGSTTLGFTDDGSEDLHRAFGWSIDNGSLSKPTASNKWSQTGHSARNSWSFQLFGWAIVREPPKITSHEISGDKLIATFDKLLNQWDVPAAGQFGIVPGSDPLQAASAIRIDGYHTIHTVPAVSAGESVTAYYNWPSGGNRLKDIYDNDVRSFNAAPVANLTGVSPSLSSAVIGDKGILTLTFDRTLKQDADTAAGQFGVKIDGGAVQPATMIAISGAQVKLTVPGVSLAQATTVSYEVPDTDKLQDDFGNDIGAFTDQAVINNVPVVSNTGQPYVRSPGWRDQFHHDQAQLFTTGNVSIGYNLDAVELVLANGPGTIAPVYTVAIHPANPDGTPGPTAIGTLTNPSALVAGRNTFVADGVIVLAPLTNYVVLVDVKQAGNSHLFVTTDSASENDGASYLWSIGDVRKLKLFNAPYADYATSTSVLAMLIRIRMDTTDPIPQLAIVDGTRLSVIFNEVLAYQNQPPSSVFTVTATPAGGGSPRTISGSATPVIPAGGTAEALLSEYIAPSDILTVEYSKPEVSPISDTFANHAETFNLLEVMNHSVSQPASSPLVGNDKEPDAANVSINQDIAQGFTPAGGTYYTLTSVQVVAANGGSVKGYEVYVMIGDEDGPGTHQLGALSALPSISAGSGNTFVGDVDLLPGYMNYIVFDFSVENTNVQLMSTTSVDENPGGMAGWSIENDYWVRGANRGSRAWTKETGALKIIIHGYETQRRPTRTFGLPPNIIRPEDEQQPDDGQQPGSGQQPGGNQRPVIIVVRGGGGGGGGGGGASAGPSPSTRALEWNVKRDIEVLARGNDNPTGSWSDGSTLWIVDNGQAEDKVYAYSQATGQQLQSRGFALHATNRSPSGSWSDGATVWISDSARNHIFAYDLASSDRLAGREIELATVNRDARSIWSDGVFLWVLDGRADALFAYGFDSGRLLGHYELDPRNRDPRGIWSDGTTVWVSDHGARMLFAYRLPEPPLGEAQASSTPPPEPAPLVRVPDEEFTRLSASSNTSPRGIWSDGDVMYVVDESDGKVYTYNMPDAIDARLAWLSLSGVEIGAFDPARTEYDGAPGADITVATVRVEAMQGGATVVIEPPDADEVVDGHQVALDDTDEVTVTVTSTDGSRTRIYRVRFGESLEPLTTCLLGAVGEGFSIVVYGGGSVDDLGACARDRSVSAVYVLHEGAYVAYFTGGPEFLNREFREFYDAGIPPFTPLVVLRERSQPGADN